MSRGVDDSYNSATGDVYEIADEDAVLDLSAQGLSSIPEIIGSHSISALYLQNNAIECIPDNFFLALPNLMWLDLRDNKISNLPKTIRFHPCLSHILLQDNQLTSLPNELGTLKSLKTLQLCGNKLTYPPKDIVDLGVKSILEFLKGKFDENISLDGNSEDSDDLSVTQLVNMLEYRDSSESEEEKPEIDYNNESKTLSVQMNGKELIECDDMKSYRSSAFIKCRKLAKARQVVPHFCQSSKYLKPLRAAGKDEQTAMMRHSFLRDLAQAKYKEMLAEREKILQDRKNLNLLRNWRTNYKNSQLALSQTGCTYTMDPKALPYDTDPEHMILLSREDIERDLPDKYRRNLTRRARVAVPRRKSGDMVLANKIKQLFVNLEKINLNRGSLTPRTEQKMLLNEIHKISEIKQKLSELSAVNFKTTSD